MLDRNLAALHAHGYATPDHPHLPRGWELDTTTATPVLNVPGPADRPISLHSRRDPDGEADRLVQAAAPSDRHAIAVVAGVGLGFVVDALERQRPDLPIVLADISFDRLVPCLSRRDWTARIAAGQLGVFSPDTPTDAGGLRRLLESREGALFVVAHPVLSRDTAGDLAATLSALNHAWRGARANREARLRFERPYFENTLANLWRLDTIDDVRRVAGSERGRPAIVVAAGPSLDRQLADLARVRESVVLIAVDTALRPLLAAGLDPDFVVAVDLSETNARHLLDLAPATHARLVGELSLPPALLDAFGERTLAYRVGLNEPWPWLVEHGVEVGILTAWGSVLVTAIDFACHLGASPVLLCGADLAFTGDRPYCRGTTFGMDAAARGDSEDVLAEQWMSARGPDLVTLADIHGQPTRAPSHFPAVRDAIVELAAKRQGYRIVNVTGAGILGGGAIEQSTIDREIGARPRAGAGRVRSRPASPRPRPAIRAGLDERGRAWRRLVTSLYDAWPHFDPSRDNAPYDATALLSTLRALTIAGQAPGSRLIVSDEAFAAEWTTLLNSPWTPALLRFVQALTVAAPNWLERFEGVLSRTAADGRTDATPYLQCALWAIRGSGDALYLPSPMAALGRIADGLATLPHPDRLAREIEVERASILAHVGRADEVWTLVDRHRDQSPRPLAQEAAQALWVGARARAIISGRRDAETAIGLAVRAWAERDLAAGRDTAGSFAFLTRTAIGSGDIDAARRHLLAGLERHPSLRFACAALALEAWEHGQDAWATELVSHADLPARRTPPQLFHRAVAMALIGDVREAGDLFDRLDRAWPTFFDASAPANNRWFNLAQAAAALGDDELVRRANAVATRLDPLVRQREQATRPAARRDGASVRLPAFTLPEEDER